MSPLAAGALGFVLGAAGAAFGARWWLRKDLNRRARMLSFIAHELNTPLTAVNMTTLNFVSGVFGALSREHQDWMLMMKEQVQRLNSLVGEMRDFIHIEFHKDLRIRLEAVDVAAALKHVLGQSEATTTRSGARLELAIDDALPRAKADPDRLARIFGSLLAHARKFRREGPIRIEAKREGGVIVVRLAFIANKMAPGEGERMVDLYYPVSRKDSQLLYSVGTGLGICRNLLERQGGGLTVRTEPEGPTDIEVRLPEAG